MSTRLHTVRRALAVTVVALLLGSTACAPSESSLVGQLFPGLVPPPSVTSITPDSGPIGPGAASEPIQTVTTVALTVPMSTLAGDLVGGDLHRRAVPLRDVAVIAEAVGAWLRRELQQPLRLAGVLTLRAEGSD